MISKSMLVVLVVGVIVLVVATGEEDDDAKKLARFGSRQWEAESNANETCLNGGIRVLKQGVYKCVCSRDYSGERCEVAARVGVCNERTWWPDGRAPCESQGKTCRPSVTGDGGFTCRSDPPRRGKACKRPDRCPVFWACFQVLPRRSDNFRCRPLRSEEKIDPGSREIVAMGVACNESKHFCEHGAECESSKCDCLMHYTGRYCDAQFNYCQTFPCPNIAYCERRLGGYNCDCPDDRTGPTCEIQKKLSLKTVKNPHFLYVPVQNSGIVFPYSFYAISLGLNTTMTVDFGDGTVITKHEDSFVQYSNFRFEILKTFFPPLMIRFNDVYACIFYHMYALPEVYTIHVQLITEEQDTIFDSIYDVNVEKPNYCSISLKLKDCAQDPSTPFIFQLKDKIDISADITVNCTKPAFDFSWVVYNASSSDGVGSFTAADVVKLDKKIETKGLTLHLHGYSLPAGNYAARLHVELTAASHLNDTAITWFVILDNVPIPNIYGGTLLENSWDKPLHLDASISRDKTYKRERELLLSDRFFWSCKEWPNATADAAGYCATKPYLNETGPYLTVPPKALQPNGQYIFTLAVNDPENEYRVIVRTAETNSIAIRIECVENCADAMNPEDITTLRAICLECTFDYVNNIYGWTVIKLSGNWTLLENQTRSGFDNDVLSIDSNVLDYGSTYLFQFTSFSAHSEDVNRINKAGSRRAELVKSTLDYYTSFESNCRIHPLRGYSILTNFTITCDVSFNNTLLTYEVMQLDIETYSSTVQMWVSYGTKSKITDIRLASGTEGSNRLTSLHVTITCHQLRAQSFNVLNVTVEPAAAKISLHDGLIQEIYIQMIGGVNPVLGLLHTAGNTYRLIQAIKMIATEINTLIDEDISEGLDLKDEEKIQFYEKIFIMREAMLEYLSQQKVHCVQVLKHLASTYMQVVPLPKLFLLPSKYQLSNTFFENIVASLKMIIAEHGVSKNDLLDIGESIMSIGFSTLNETQIKSINSSNTERVEYHEWALNKLLDSEEKDNTLKNLTASVIETILDLSHFLARYIRANGPVAAILTEWGQLSAKKVMLNGKNSSLQMNISHGAVSLVVQQDYLNKTLIMSVLEATGNPYWWLRSFKGNSFPFVSVRVQQDNVTTKTSYPLDCRVDLDPLKNEPKPKLIHGELDIVPFWILNESHIQTYRFEFRVGGKVALRIPPLEEKIQLVIKKDVRPRIHDFWNDAITLPESDHAHQVHGMACRLIVVDNVTVERNQLVYVGIIPHIDTLRKLMDTGNKVYRFNFPDAAADEADPSADEYFSDDVGDEDTTPEYDEGAGQGQRSEELPDASFVKEAAAGRNKTRKLPFAFNLQVVSCHSFDEDTLKIDEGMCYVNRSESFTIACTCQKMHNPLFKFQSGFQERSIFMDTLFSLTAKENPVILIVLLYIIGIFLVLFIWARAVDKDDRWKRDVIFLKDNNPTYEYTYVLIVYTGHRPQAGTTSNVAIQLVGEDATSAVHILTADHRPVLTRGSQDWFVLKTERDLGQVTWINLWHDHYGASPAWYCDRVIVHDIQTYDVFVFVTSQWLAPLYGDGTMSCSVDRTTDMFGKRRRFADRFMDACNAGHHAWLGVFQKRADAPSVRLTRCQRVGMALAYLATITALVAHLYAGKAADGDESVTHASVVLYGAMAALLAAPVYIALYWLFRCIKPPPYEPLSPLDVSRSLILNPGGPQKNSDDADVLMNKERTKLPYTANEKRREETNTPLLGERIVEVPFCLPSCCLYIAWLILVLIVGTCAYVSTFQGIMLSHFLSMCFLLSFGVAIPATFLVETVKVALVAIYSLFTRNRLLLVEDRTELVRYLNERQKRADERFVPEILEELRALRLQTIYKPIPPQRVQRLRKTAISEATARHVVGDLCLFLMFTIILACILYGIKHTNQYIHVQNIQNLLTAYTPLDEIHNQTGYIKYINDSVFPQIYGEGEEETVADLVNFLVGVPRFRQIRLSRESCKPILDSEPDWASRCYVSHPLWMEGDTDDYEPQWRTRTSGDGGEMWQHRDVWELQTPPVVGNTTIYPGGGYVAPLKRNMASSRATLADLAADGWYDDLTVALFLELVLYNGNLKLASTVTLLGERPVTGGYHVTSRVAAVKLDPAASTAKIVALVMFVVFVIVTVLYMRGEGNRIVRLCVTRYVGNCWYALRVVVVLLGVVAVALFVVCVVIEESYMRKLQEADSEEFLDFYGVVFWAEALNIVLALMYFFIIIELWHIISFYFEFQIMLTTLHVASYSLFCYCVGFAVLLLAFAWSGHLLFASTSYTFSTVWHSFVSVCGFYYIRRLFQDTTIIGSVIGVWQAIYFFVLFVAYMFILRWIFAVILIGKYKRVVQYARNSWLDPVLNRHLRARVASRAFLRMRKLTRDYVLATMALFVRTSGQLPPARFLAMKQIVGRLKSKDEDPEFMSEARSLAMASLVVSEAQKSDPVASRVARANPVVRTSLRMAELQNKVKKLEDLVTDLVDKE